MKSVLKPRFKHLVDVMKEIETVNDSSNESQKSIESIGDGWEGDSESVYEIAEDYLNTDQDLEVDVVKAQKEKKDGDEDDQE